MKLSSSIMSHPPGGLCYVNIVFSTFSNGLLLRKFDWNDESITLSIIDGQLVVRMATGSGQDISVSSPYIVTDGLEHSVTLSTGVGRLSLAVDDDITRQVESRAQPGLGNDANVFVGGQPGGDYSGYSGCIDSLSVLVTANLEPPDWSLAVRVDFTGTTILYGNYECGVCRLREAGGQQQSDLGEVWGEVSELPRPLSSLPSLSSLSPYNTQPGPETNRGYSSSSQTNNYDWTVKSKPILVLDRQTTPQTTTASTTSTTTTSTTSTTSTTITTTTTTTTTSTTTTTTTSTSTTTTSTTSTTTRLELVRGVCSASEVYLGGGGWLEMSSKLLPHRRNMKTILKIDFSSRQRNSLLLWQGDHRTQHYFAVALVNGFLEFRSEAGMEFS